MINNKKQTAQTHPEQTTPKGLSKVEGILTSSLQLKGTRTNQPYYLAFFSIRGYCYRDTNHL